MKDEKKAPKLRFKGFTDDWEQCKLKNKAEIVRGASPRPISNPKWFDDNSNVGWLRISDVTEQRGRIHHLSQRISKAGQSKTRVITEPHLLLSIAATVGSPVINYVNTGVHDGFLIFLNPTFDKEFMFQWLLMFKPYWNKYGQPGSQVNLNSDIVGNQSVAFPTMSEQERIADFFSKLDTAITLHEEKKRQLEHLKSALLQKMFADKSGYPAVRFEGFSNEWEHCKLGNVADITTGSRNHQDSVTDGKYPFFVRSDKVERLNEYDFDTKAILVPGDGRIGEIFHYYNGKFALHQRVYKVDNFNGINELFLLGLFKYSFKEHALRLNAQGTVPSLRLPMFTNWSISVPMITEQERIGVFFQKLDRTISLYDHKLELLKKVKRSMLQAMFI
ncbi:restriction endonuclease subunit S (plasmid) [Lactobacillus delbrueckii subsp. indicus]|uniref:restriction endonuclease subunit S n=2 Tax=Lactobacillus delbrueckii TaxID=1584 RepID=UPI00093836AE|nr:restriction endonuclease subunit S [Lactobacillus delbrueckii]APP02152.1 restriction endonuclease subunit S [Lactobacillus delbrueckii subsp. indicus]